MDLYIKGDYLVVKMSHNKVNIISFFLLLVILVLFGIVVLKAQTDPFTITEKTEYSLTKNVVYLEITENLGKDQTINISNDFFNSALTQKISYEEVLLNQSYI